MPLAAPPQQQRQQQQQPPQQQQQQQQEEEPQADPTLLKIVTANIDPSQAEGNDRRTKSGKFTLAQLRATEGICPLQNGTNQFDSQKKEKLKEKLIDTKKMKMSDLVEWKPKTENTLKKKWSEKRKQMKTIEGGGEKAMKTESSIIKTEANTSVAGPRVKINEHGEMVVDEESLVVVKNPENNAWETVNDDLLPKKITSLSFRKKQRRQVWSILETDLFYEVLAATGTDFGLMNEFIPTRSRIELKKKYNREERTNLRRINETLRRPAMLDERLHQRVERMLEAMDERE